jgi:hypothetical protein
MMAWMLTFHPIFIPLTFFDCIVVSDEIVVGLQGTREIPGGQILVTSGTSFS